MSDDTEPGNEYSLGPNQKAADVYDSLAAKRQQVVEMGRLMAELTIPSVSPPDGYKAGDDLPGNNQSIGAQCVNTLASKIMFMAFPPGQPIMKLEAIVTKLRDQIAQDPKLYGLIQLALSQLEVEHRKRALATPLATAYFGYIKALLVIGNALWKHIKINSPTFHRPDSYVVSRDGGGHPLLVIHKETLRLTTLAKDIQEMILRKTPELAKVPDWEREADLYSVCRFKRGDGARHEDGYWCYWQEYEGEFIPGTGVETDYDDCPMWAGWMIPVYGDNWGRSYCEEYRGDLFTVEAHASGLNDIVALAAWAIPFVKPGARTSIRQLKKARNLEMLSGSAEDVTVFRSEKTGDGAFVSQNMQAVARRLSAAFLLQHAIQREGERVTAEEIARLGQELDKAMGGLQTQISQGDQRRIITRFVRLHEEDNPELPSLPPGTVRLSVITGMDAMGRSQEGQALRGYVGTLREAFPEKSQSLNFTDFATRLAAADGIDPRNLVPSEEEMAAEEQRAAQQAAGMALLEKGTAPAVKGLLDTAQPQQQQQG